MTPLKKTNSAARPPVVAVMGHVDHGKTTLLDFIRKTSVASREAGGITQAIGAYEVAHQGRLITFIDTPGHEAFACMRTHGAKSADLAILVVAADDGVKPQTKDALACIAAADIPFVVAVNKIDKPNANIEKVKQDLAQAGVLLEGYGGSVSWHAVSAKTGEGVSELLDLVLLSSDLEGPTYDAGAVATGMVVTARLDKRRGIVAGVIVLDGTLRKGDYIATETASGRVKMLENYLGKNADSLIPSAPALIIGFDTLPAVGQEFYAAAVMPAVERKKIAATAQPSPVRGAAGAVEKSVPLVLKADEAGSLEALIGVVAKLTATLPFSIIASSVGDIYETDVKTAESMGAVVVGFRVKVDRGAENLARSKKILVLGSPIIYELEKDLERYAAKVAVKEVRALEVLGVFGAPKGKQRVVGGKIILGPVRNHESFELWHEKRLLGPGRILNLQSQRSDVAEAATGAEVGMLVECEEPVKIGYRLVFSD
jgi:translation initiation factor IF-2